MEATKKTGEFKTGVPTVSSCFDSGNGIFESLSDDGKVLKVAIKDDPYTQVDGRSHKMWFHFKVANLEETKGPLKVILTNAGDCSYPGGWGGVAPPEGAASYRTCFSTDRKEWLRLNATEYVNGELHMTLDASEEPALCGVDAVWLAYFAPYSQEEHMNLMGSVVTPSPLASIRTFGQTLDGADMEMITVRENENEKTTTTKKKSLWFIARQHPGESMASFWMEGFVRRLLDPADPVAAALLSKADVHVVPMMNPDGARRGYLRTNAAGANLNREWKTPTEEYSPEVFHVMREMRAEGLDFCLDVHGDEALPYNFISGSEGCACWSPKLAKLQKDWCDAYEAANPDFQQVHGYDIDKPGEANMLICSNALTQAFDALVMTLEMPFKDNANRPNVNVGWGTRRCEVLGAASLDATLAIIDSLR
jgi:murein tripeptide amidase MpaA